MRFSGFVGVILAFGVLLGDISLAENVFYFIYLPALLVCIFGTIGLSYLSYGALDTLTTISSLRLLILTPDKVDNLARRAEVMNGAIIHLYACGAVGALISLIKMLAFSASLQTFHWAASPTLLTLLPIFYAVVGAEFLLRPAARRLRSLEQAS